MPCMVQGAIISSSSRLAAVAMAARHKGGRAVLLYLHPELLTRVSLGSRNQGSGAKEMPAQLYQ
jgi:hypothetical protein